MSETSMPFGILHYRMGPGWPPAPGTDKIEFIAEKLRPWARFLWVDLVLNEERLSAEEVQWRLICGATYLATALNAGMIGDDMGRMAFIRAEAEALPVVSKAVEVAAPLIARKTGRKAVLSATEAAIPQFWIDWQQLQEICTRIAYWLKFGLPADAGLTLLYPPHEH